MPSSERIVHVVDDDEAVRRSAALLLEKAGYHVETYASGRKFLNAVGQAKPGCVLLDLRMPDIDGLAVQRALAVGGYDWPVIVLTAHGDVGTAVLAMKAGAVDFIEKPYDRATLFAAIEGAFERFRQSGEQAQRVAVARDLVARLSRRERDVLEGLLAGLPNKAIAFNLGISPRTVEIHRAHMMEKLQARSLSDALRIAIAAEMPARDFPARDSSGR